jgi:hypothetical protein
MFVGDLDRLVRLRIDGEQLLDGFSQRLVDRRRVAAVGALHCDPHDDSRVEINAFGRLSFS